jgi:hypothetical protein
VCVNIFYVILEYTRIGLYLRIASHTLRVLSKNKGLKDTEPYDKIISSFTISCCYSVLCDLNYNYLKEIIGSTFNCIFNLIATFRKTYIMDEKNEKFTEYLLYFNIIH